MIRNALKSGSVESHVGAARHGGAWPPTGRTWCREALPAAVPCHRDRRREAMLVPMRAPAHRGFVRSMGWNWMGRLRGRTQVKPRDEPNRLDQWFDSRQLRVVASTTPREPPSMQANRGHPIDCRLVVYAKARKGLANPDRRTKVSRSSSSLKA